MSEEDGPSNDELKDAGSLNGNVNCGLMFETDEIVEEGSVVTLFRGPDIGIRELKEH